MKAKDFAEQAINAYYHMTPGAYELGQMALTVDPSAAYHGRDLVKQVLAGQELSDEDWVRLGIAVGGWLRWAKLWGNSQRKVVVAVRWWVAPDALTKGLKAGDVSGKQNNTHPKYLPLCLEDSEAFWDIAKGDAKGYYVRVRTESLEAETDIGYGAPTVHGFAWYREPMIKPLQLIAPWSMT